MKSVSRNLFSVGDKTKCLMAGAMLAGPMVLGQAKAYAASDQLNFLICVSDDQSMISTGFAGDPAARTPVYDKLAREGVAFTNAHCSASSCAPSRAALLTGRNFYELREGAILFSSFPKEIPTFQKLLWDAGYYTGYTGKAWGPGRFNAKGGTFDPGGVVYNHKKLDAPKFVERNDYVANFKDFLKDKNDGQPFSFFFGCIEPHRPYKPGIGLENGYDLDKIEVPGFLPDTPGVRSDMADYYYEIEWFDAKIGEMIEVLREAGELENTVIIITGDNGMPFAGAKSQCYDVSTREPFVVYYPAKFKGGRVIEDPISLADIAPTILELAEVEQSKEQPMTRQSFANILLSDEEGKVDPTREFVVTGLEKHNKPFPIRSITQGKYHYIRNYAEPGTYRFPVEGGYIWAMKKADSPEQVQDKKADVYGGMMREHPTEKKYVYHAWGPRPAEELYDLEADPWEWNNLADDPEYASIKQELSGKLTGYLVKTNDPRHTGGTIEFASYQRYGRKDFEDVSAENKALSKKWYEEAHALRRKLVAENKARAKK
ncbi:sulfatase [Planctomycetota bacterium]|nr:sulfatase [Planctomycetota bacterium]